MDAPLWTPTPERAARTAMAGLGERLSRDHGVDGEDPVARWRWSVEHLGPLWRAVWDDAAVAGEPGTVDFDPGDGSLTGGRFFPEARVSFAENLLALDRARPDDVAIIAEREDGPRGQMTRAELAEAVAAAAGALGQAGVGPGDRVAAWVPNVPEAVVTMLATTALGAVFTSSSPDFGVTGVLDRFGQVEPTVLLAADGYLYGGRRHDCLERLAAIQSGLPTLRQTVVVGHLDAEPDLSGLRDAVRYDDWLGAARPDRVAAGERRPFDHAGFILYSSGTTGPPKCIVHRAAGVLLKHRNEHHHHCDVQPGDRVFYFTTCGWMMWNWLVSALAAPAAIVLYDGNPLHPGPEVLFDVARRHDVSLMGVSAKYLDAVRGAGVRPVETHALGSLRTVCSTGSPLSPEGFAYVYDAVAPDVHLASISGGTDLCGCFVAGDPTRPVHAGEIQGPALGMDVDVVDESGLPMDGPGELVCRRPFPSMPLGFWGDDNGQRYHDAYFDRFPGLWTHGDFASWTDHGGVVIHGRSDATLNAGGVRIGTAELYRVVESLPEVDEAVAVGQETAPGDTRIVLFVRLGAGEVLDDGLRDRIRSALRSECSPRHVPAVVAEVSDIPRTRSGKISERAVRDVVMGQDVANVGALANPEALHQYADRPELGGA